MFQSKDHFKYILLVVDVFSTHIYTECLKDKTAKTVGQSLEKIFTQFETPISKFETDQVNNQSIVKLRYSKRWLLYIFFTSSSVFL